MEQHQPIVKCLMALSTALAVTVSEKRCTIARWDSVPPVAVTVLDIAHLDSWRKVLWLLPFPDGRTKAWYDSDSYQKPCALYLLAKRSYAETLTHWQHLQTTMALQTLNLHPYIYIYYKPWVKLNSDPLITHQTNSVNSSWIHINSSLNPQQKLKLSKRIPEPLTRRLYRHVEGWWPLHLGEL